MNVVFFYHGLGAGGAERNIALLSNYLAKNGHSTSIVVVDDKKPFYVIDDKIRFINLGLEHSSSGFVDAIKNNCRIIRALNKALVEINPDIVIGFSAKHVLYSVLARKKLRYKTIGSERSNPYLLKKGYLNKMSARLADGYVFQTKGAKGYYPKSVQKRSIILQNPIIPYDFQKYDRPWEKREGICACGRMVESKCFDDLLHAFAKINKKNPNIHLDLYGDGFSKSLLEELTRMLGIESFVTFHGESENIYEAYAQHKYFVMASRIEGMPNVLIEAMASGCACVSTDCNFGPSDLIKDGENGYLVNVHQVDDMANKIHGLINDDETARCLSMNALNIRKTNDIDKIGTKFVNYLSNVKKGK